jgi:rhodanese-related sulfurtransferase
MSLHVTAFSSDLWRVLQYLIQLPALADFYLVGGTALALRLGHRESVDLRGIEWTQIKDNLRNHITCQRTSSESNDTLLEPGPRAQALRNKALIIDIREPQERISAPDHILSMPNVPRAEWESIPERFPQRPIVLCCAGGVRTRYCVEMLGNPPGIFAWTRPIGEW